MRSIVRSLSHHLARALEWRADVLALSAKPDMLAPYIADAPGLVAASLAENLQVGDRLVEQPAQVCKRPAGEALESGGGTQFLYLQVGAGIRPVATAACPPPLLVIPTDGAER